jgi:hypothetical protein
MGLTQFFGISSLLVSYLSYLLKEKWFVLSLSIFISPIKSLIRIGSKKAYLFGKQNSRVFDILGIYFHFMSPKI